MFLRRDFIVRTYSFRRKIGFLIAEMKATVTFIVRHPTPMISTSQKSLIKQKPSTKQKSSMKQRPVMKQKLSVNRKLNETATVQANPNNAKIAIDTKLPLRKRSFIITVNTETALTQN